LAGGPIIPGRRVVTSKFNKHHIVIGIQIENIQGASVSDDYGEIKRQYLAVYI
jgi:hypothetical protein